MLWLPLTLLTALCVSLMQVFQKQLLHQDLDEILLLWCVNLAAWPFMLMSLFWFGVPGWNMEATGILMISGVMNLLATFLSLKALKLSDISLTIPMLSFTPALMLLTSPLLLGEFPRPLGIAGIGLIVTGSYVLHLKNWSDGYLAPITAVFHEKGTRLMLLVALILSVLANIDKIGVQRTSTISWGVAVNTFLVIALTLLVVRKKKFSTALIHWKKLTTIGLLYVIASFSGLIAIQLTLASYMIAVKRTSILMSVFWGYLFFNEPQIKKRFIAAVIMVSGIILIAFQSQR
ncbi:MAG: EamA family transporter [SAR324 cluster bacterium]|nr:EamA family transporter [SAR324 cluster bacterium]